MTATGFVVALGFAVLMVLAGTMGLVCGRARARAAAGRRRQVQRTRNVGSATAPVHR
jgi:hypothetical protein